MKKTFNQKIIVGLLIASFVIVFPQKSLAYNSNSVCRRIFSIESQVLKEQSSLRNETREKRNFRGSDIKKEWTARSQNQNIERVNSDKMFENLLTSIKSRATTEAEKTAVVEFEKNIKNALAESRAEIDKILADYETAILASLSNQDAQSEKYFQEIEKESGERIGNIRNLCKSKKENLSKIKGELESVRKMSDRGLARSTFIRKSKLEIDQLTEAKNKKIEEIRSALIAEINTLYNALPETLR